MKDWCYSDGLLMTGFSVTDSKKQDPNYALLRPSARWLFRVDVYDGPIGTGTQDLVWEGIDGELG
jgi:hypothetical protein